ncbi:MAG: DUF6850 family outer membrane beta-barrel protein [Bacteroidaceae bacterium]
MTLNKVLKQILFMNFMTNQQLYRYIGLVFLTLCVCMIPYTSKGQALEHAALTYYKYAHDKAEMSLTYTYERSPQAVVQQYGRGINQMEFEVNAYHILNKNSRLWGEVSYTNACTFDIQGTETSDYDLVYPYVVADEVGGDMKSEAYQFNTGYAWHHKKWTFGGTLGYRALLAYRDIDPRPKNTIGHLKSTISVAYDINLTHLWSVHIGGEKYKQATGISLYNPYKTVLFYHDTGLGTDYSRFSGKGCSTDITGQFYQFSMAYYPKTGNGFGAQFDWKNKQLQKVLSGFNALPLNDLRSNSYKYIAYYVQNNLSNRWKIQSSWYTANRKGTENIFGSDASTTYEKISSRQYYNQRIYAGTIEGLYSWNLNHKHWYEIAPKVSWISNEQVHKRDHRELDYTWLVASLETKAHLLFKKSTLHLSIIGQMRWVPRATCNFDIQQYTFVNKNHIMDANHQQMMTINVRYDTPWLVADKQIYVMGSYSHGRYAESLQTHRGTCGLGIIF